MIDLIPAGLVHADLLGGMHRICFAEPWNPKSMAEVLALAGTEGLIAVDGKSLAPATEPPGPAGLILWRRIFDEAEILTIAVLPPWRRRGVGARLLDAAMENAARAGALTMFLEAAADNEAALALYESRKFNRVGLRKGYYGAIDGVTMSCRLDETSVSS
ncbi:Ribosomal-protein-S18p-alanine acetyltransferase [Paramagnetospirillum magnetotacticum MS-1]|uniref:Ribosomal-protein-S18p-alanine acetyltransferase n=1 Tax=Paramagnetospirillum magnetotacticum MS-1 TaxID=272627 RepID=A0A0C2YTC5_PARME|nr:GNAT family N-acetyltransferase [Paramagnetospirillum magnetotacticum]KIL97955.1 Ribosomal-protein-S18p-alanine acetyltransferase [Paramagnetospirillum magnetotacticum MS-1]